MVKLRLVWLDLIFPLFYVSLQGRVFCSGSYRFVIAMHNVIAYWKNVFIVQYFRVYIPLKDYKIHQKM